MLPQDGAGTLERTRRVHVIGAGPVGLILTALLQPVDGLEVELYEKRREYTRTRMVKLAPYLAAKSVEDYRIDQLDGDNVAALYDPAELAAILAARQEYPSDLRQLLQRWTRGFVPLNEIERDLSSLIDERQDHPVERNAVAITAEEVMDLVEPGDLVVDCTGSRSLLREHLVPGDSDNTLSFVFEHALVITFLYNQTYTCNEMCKYYKNVENPRYKFIPMVSRVSHDGTVTHVTGIVTISDEEFDAMPTRFDGEWLREHFPDVGGSMDRFIAKVKDETQGEVISNIEIIRIPLNLYRARNATSRKLVGQDHPFATAPAILVGDSAIGSPYFQSITLGFECAMYLAGLIAEPGIGTGELLDRHEDFIYKQWLRVYIQTKLIKNNKDLFQLLDQPMELLDRLHIY